MELDHLGDLVANGVNRRERRHRLLEDHGNVAAADLVHLVAMRGERGEVDRVLVQLASVADVAAGNLGGRRQNLQQGIGRHGLAAPAFADDAHGLAGVDAEADAVERTHHALVAGDADAQVVDIEEGRGHKRLSGVEFRGR